MKQYNITPYYLLALLVLIMSACSKMDDYKTKYMPGGSITYPGIMDSVKIYSGKNRVIVTGLFTSDPKIVKYRVFWNSGHDSVEVPVKRTSGVDTARVSIPNLPEGTMSFEIRTYDANNHKSIPINLATNVYGNLYASGISNRGIIKSEYQSDKSGSVSWVDVNADAGVVAMEIKYINSFGVAKDTMIKSSSRACFTSLPNVKIGNKISYRTAYLPIPTAIDTFYTNYQDQSVKADITSTYLKNYISPFTSSSGTSRWRNPSNWTVSTSVFNHSGLGGLDNDNKALSIEAGWGAGDVPNGKVYQTITLPAGTYSYAIVLGSNGFTGAAYIVAAVGTTIPDAALVPANSLGYAVMTNLNFSFVLTQTTQVSLGFVANFVGGTNQSVRVMGASLYAL